MLHNSTTPIPEFMANFANNESTTYGQHQNNVSVGFNNGVQNIKNGFENGDDSNVWIGTEAEQSKFIAPVVKVTATSSVTNTIDRQNYWTNSNKQAPIAEPPIGETSVAKENGNINDEWDNSNWDEVNNSWV